MKASSIVDNVINIKKDISKVNKNSDNSFNKFMDSEKNNINNNINNDTDYARDSKDVSENKVEEPKTVFKKIENIKNNEVKPQEVKEILSEKLPKKLEKMISFLTSSEKGEISEEKLSELKSLIQNLISNLKKLKEQDNPKNKEQIISDLKELNQNLKELFPDKDIKINLLNIKDNMVVDIKIDDKSLVLALDDEKLSIYKYNTKDANNNPEKTKIPIKNDNENLDKIAKNKVEIQEDQKTDETKESKSEKKSLLSLVHKEKLIGENKITEDNTGKKILNENGEITKNSIVKIQQIISNFIENKRQNSSQDKANDSKIKLSQMLVNKNDFIKLSKNVSYFDLTERMNSKLKSENKTQKNHTDNKKSIKNIDIKPLEKETADDKNIINKNSTEEKTNEKKGKNVNDDTKIKISTENADTNKTSKTVNNETSSNGSIKINPTNNNSTNFSITRTPQAQTLNLSQFNAHIQDIVNQRATENTFREIVTLKVNPPDLGNVDVEIAKNGKSVSISIMTENENAKSFITRTIQSLIGNLRDQGFNPINVKVETAPEPDLMDTEKQDEQNNEQEQQTEENNEEREFENILRGEENV